VKSFSNSAHPLPNDKLINAGLLIVSSIFCLIALEFGLRAYHGQWGYINFRFPPGDHLKEGYPVEFDAELGWIPKQDVRAIPNTWGTTVTILKDGVRSNGGGEGEDATDPILAVGDSFTFGEQVSDWETWPAQLEKLLGRRVINGGVSGYGADQAFLRARRLLNQYRYSVVIFSFIPDDIRRCRMSVEFGGAKPFFDFKNGQLALENVPVLRLTFPSPQESSLLIALEHSRLADAILKRIVPEWWLAPERAYEKQVHDEEKGTKVVCALLHELEGLTKSRGSELVVLVQHEHKEAFSKSMPDVLSCLSDDGTRVLDLNPALSELEDKDPSRYNHLYYSYGGHMTAQGNQFVAQEVLKTLTQGSMRIGRVGVSSIYTKGTEDLHRH
jgi:hypothetical protein